MECIDAPMPYIIGVPRFLWKSLKTLKGKDNISQETAIFDINKKKITYSGTIPNWPVTYFESVQRCLIDINEESQKYDFFEN